MVTPSSPVDLLQMVRRQLAPAEGGNRLVPLVAEGRLPRERLAALAGEEYRIIPSDRRSLLVLAARFPQPPAVDFFVGLAQGESLALSHLLRFAEALGLDERGLQAYEPQPGCQAYPAYVAWLALNGSQADVALALIANFAAWGSYCGAVADGLRRHYGLDGGAVGFFDYFAAPVPEVEQQALAVVQASLDAGAPPEGARRYARLVQAYELMFWNTLAEQID
jgi:TENA/THI-4/PQQC family